MPEGESLKKVVQEIYEKLKENPSQYGFHISYSPESSWSGDADFLILTMNPSSKNAEGDNETIIPYGPWPHSNDFFEAKNKFRIKKTVQALCYELARLYACPECEEIYPFTEAKYFANHCAVLASLVPFRTPSNEDIGDEMYNFAINEFWKPVFEVWQPRFIITFGQQPFDGICKILAGKSSEVEKVTEKVNDESGGLSYKLLKYEMPTGVKIMLIGLPYPTAFGERGFPTNFPQDAEKDSFLRRFLDKFLKPECKGHEPRNDRYVLTLEPVLISRILEDLANTESWQYTYDQNVYGDYAAPVREFAANYGQGAVRLNVDREAIYIEYRQIVAVIPLKCEKYPNLSAAAMKLLDTLREKSDSVLVTQCKAIDNQYERISGEYLDILTRAVKSPVRWIFTGSNMVYTCADMDIEYRINASCEFQSISCNIIDDKGNIINVGRCEAGDPCYDDLKNDILRLKTMICRNSGEMRELVRRLQEDQEN